MSTMPLVPADLYPASANCSDLRQPLKITGPSGSWGLPESSQIQAASYQRVWAEGPRHAVPLPTHCWGRALQSRPFGSTHLSRLLSQLLLYFSLFHVVLSLPPLPLALHPLLLFLLSLLFHDRKLPLHAAWRCYRSQQRPSVSSHMPGYNCVHFFPSQCLTCDLGDVGFFHFCWLHLFFLIAGGEKFFYLQRIMRKERER